MMKITRENYEAFCLDQLEGRLSPEMERELESFLEQNPDLRPDPEFIFPLAVNNQAGLDATFKQRMQKQVRPTAHIHEANADEWLVRETENMLTAAEVAELKDFIALNPAFEYDRKVFGMTRMNPDLSIQFPDKQSLKKQLPVITLRRAVWFLSSAAALILIILGIRFAGTPVETPVKYRMESYPAVVRVETVREKKMELKATQTETAPLNPEPQPTRATSFRLQSLAHSGVIEQNNPALAFINLKTETLPAITPDEEGNHQTIIAKAFGNLMHKAKEAVIRNPEVENLRNANMDFWSIAGAGVRGFNTVTDRDLELLVRRDDRGNITSYALVESDRLIVTRSLGKN